jgi:hypothetical protein
MKAYEGWAVVLGTITAHELSCDKGNTLSEGVDRALEKHPILTIGAIAITSAHLINLLPEKIDPFHQTLKAIKHG